MKVITGQKHREWHDLATVALDSLDEANGLVKAAIEDKAFLSKSYKDCMRIVGANPSTKGLLEQGFSPQSLKNNLLRAIGEIENGKPELDKAINTLAEKLVDLAKYIEPSLTLDTPYRPSEEGEMFDAGKIASEDPVAFFNRRQEDRLKSGKGDGAFRILINTDCAWWMDPVYQCAALIAIVQLLQRQAPVEIWVQQGWMGRANTDGVTLFKVFSGTQLVPKQVYFWVGSKYKDMPYSWCVNKMLGRSCSRVSIDPELPCDLYIYGGWMPNIATEPECFAKWVALTSRQLLFDEEMPNGWTGYQSKMPECNPGFEKDPDLTEPPPPTPGK